MSDVRGFGAKGDGKTDDAEAIRHALADGDGELLFPPGNYLIGSTIKVDLSKLRRFSARGTGGAAKAAQEDAGEGGLHGALEEDAVGVGVAAFDLEIGESGHALVLPDGVLKVLGRCGFAVGADDLERKAGASHQELGGAAGSAGGEAAEL